MPQLDKALEIYQTMLRQNMDRSVITFSSLISACEKVRHEQEGRGRGWTGARDGGGGDGGWGKAGGQEVKRWEVIILSLQGHEGGLDEQFRCKHWRTATACKRGHGERQAGEERT